MRKNSKAKKQVRGRSNNFLVQAEKSKTLFDSFLSENSELEIITNPIKWNVDYEKLEKVIFNNTQKAEETYNKEVEEERKRAKAARERLEFATLQYQQEQLEMFKNWDRIVAEKGDELINIFNRPLTKQQKKRKAAKTNRKEKSDERLYDLE